MNILTALRIFGPIDVISLTEEINLHISPARSLQSVHDELWRMCCSDGTAAYDEAWLWDVTPAGRLLFDAQCAVRKDECAEVTP